MNVGILGLGLIGGSLARAYAKAGHTVFAYDLNREILEFAQLADVVRGELNTDTIGCCNLILLAIFPDGSAEWLEKHAHFVRKDAMVMDCCGTKARICSRCFPIAEKFDFTYIGGHPMAGTQHSGFKYSQADMFRGQPMILVPPRFDDIHLLQWAKEMLAPCEFGHYSVTTAEDHDRMIAFTSQMAHIVSNAYIKSPTALCHKGFSAGSYKDLTRVARLNPQMWAELFLENRENILSELNYFINNLQSYRDAIDHRDMPMLAQLLEDGRNRKVQVDG